MNAVGKAPKANVKAGRSFSIIWVVPIIALLIGGWLSYQAWSEKGPVITITFKNAEGLSAEKTKIRYKDVEIGQVTGIRLNKDLSGVTVTAEINKDAAEYMRNKTEFWVVRARVAAGEVSGLSTLFSGAYIGCSPSVYGELSNNFKGLEKPPIVTDGKPGRYFVLRSSTLGSLDVGSPVYYRGIKVGQVVEYGFASAAEAVNVTVFVNAPYYEKVRKSTRFWNASGINLDLDTEGMSIDTQSLVSIMLGGVAFDLPEYAESGEEAEEYKNFKLYDSKEKIHERSYAIQNKYLMYFDQNVSGLSPGAPVEIRGIKIGEILDVKLEMDVDKVEARVAVLVVIEPERIDTVIEDQVALDDGIVDISENERQQLISRMSRKGLRAQLKTGNLLTGQLYVDLDFYPDLPFKDIVEHNGYRVIPTLDAPLEQIAQRVNNILKKIERVPFEEIGEELRTTIRSLDSTLKATEVMAGGVNDDVIPELKEALNDFQSAMQGIEETLGPDSTINYNAKNATSEMNSTIRSLRALIDYLDRNPQAVIFGKEEE